MAPVNSEQLKLPAQGLGSTEFLPKQSVTAGEGAHGPLHVRSNGSQGLLEKTKPLSLVMYSWGITSTPRHTRWTPLEKPMGPSVKKEQEGQQNGNLAEREGLTG